MHKPNIILINCDDLGYGDLGSYGSKLNNTPTIDYLAENGMKFTDFYMAAPLCSPSRGAMMTGCYPRRIGFGTFDGERVLFPGQPIGLNPEEITIAKILKQQDYSTMLIGKWHCGDQPEFLPMRHGFDHYYGLPYSNDMGIQFKAKRSFPPLPLMEDEEVVQEQPSQSSLTERYVEQAVKFIRKNKDRPFFLYFAHMHVHLPLYVSERFIKESKNGSYGAAVACIDWAASALLHELRVCNLEENTLIIFTSDNGSRGDHGGSNGQLRGKKATTWEGGQRVPCIMYWKGKIRAGKECSEIVTAMDFLPTLANLCGVQMPSDRIIDGNDITPLIFEEGSKSPTEAFFYYDGDKLEAMRVGDWKLHVYKGNEEIRELYNLKTDIGENKNVYDLYPEKVSKLMTYIEKCREDLGDSVTGVPGLNTRPVGRVNNPKPLTQYNPDHPYIISMYDLEDRG
jgi:arylsulfatase A